MADIAANTLITDPPELMLEGHLYTLVLHFYGRNLSAISFSHVFLNIGLNRIQVSRKCIGNRIQFFHSRLCIALPQSNQLSLNLNAVVSSRKPEEVTRLILLNLVNPNVHQKVTRNTLVLTILNSIIHSALES